MNKEKELNNKLANNYAYAKALKNAKIYSSSEGKEEDMIDLKDINPKNVKFKGIENIEQDNGLIFENSHFEILLPNGEHVILTVDREGKDMSCDFVDKDGKSQKFLLTPRMQEEIMMKAVNGNIKGNVDTQFLQEALFPVSQEEMEKEIEKDTLIPKDAMETVKKLKEKNPNVDVKENIEEEKSVDEKTNKNSDEIEEEEKGDEEIQLPEDIKDTIEQIKQRDGSKLKHILLTKNPSSVTDQLMDDAGIQENGEPVYCLSFRSGDINSNDRIVFIQGSKVIDDRRYDEDGSKFMNNYRNSKVVENVKDMESKVLYTDMDGHTFVAEMIKEPRDLKPDQKIELDKKLDELMSKEEAIKKSDMPLDTKLEMLEKINNERIKEFNEYGIEVPEIRAEIEADIEKANEIQEDLKEDQEIAEDDGRDPRESNHDLGERNLYD